jgi:hypothetical protein
MCKPERTSRRKIPKPKGMGIFRLSFLKKDILYLSREFFGGSRKTVFLDAVLCSEFLEEGYEQVALSFGTEIEPKVFRELLMGHHLVFSEYLTKFPILTESFLESDSEEILVIVSEGKVPENSLPWISEHDRLTQSSEKARCRILNRSFQERFFIRKPMVETWCLNTEFPRDSGELYFLIFFSEEELFRCFQ